MSEYQYYEFRAVDTPLTAKQMRELRGISTRAEITPTRFTNEYHWGSFKGDPLKMVFQYFDAFLYFANWGTRELMFRLPGDALDAKAAGAYATRDGGLTLRAKGGLVVVDFLCGVDGGGEWEGAGDWGDEEGEEEDEGDEFDEYEGYAYDDEGPDRGLLDPLLPLREALAEGDLRPLYLGWLSGVNERGVEEDAPEPPLPAGMNELTPAMKALARFLRVDGDLLAIAAIPSAPLPATATPGRKEMERRVAALPEAERNAVLLDLATGELAQARRTLLRRLRETAPPKQAAPAAKVDRTAGDLLAARDAVVAERKRLEAEHKAREKARRAAEAAAARAKYLEQLSGRQEQAWEKVEALVGSKQQNAYDEAVKLLKDLRDVSVKQEALRAFHGRVRTLHERHVKKSTFVERLRKAGMLSWGGAA